MRGPVDLLRHPAVCRFWTAFQYELLPPVHSVRRLRVLCRSREEIRHYILPCIRHEGRKGVVSDQLLARQCHLHRLKESGKILLLASAPWMTD